MRWAVDVVGGGGGGGGQPWPVNSLHWWWPSCNIGGASLDVANRFTLKVNVDGQLLEKLSAWHFRLARQSLLDCWIPCSILP